MDLKITSPFFRGNRLQLLGNAIRRQREGWLFEEHGIDNFRAGVEYGVDVGVEYAQYDVPKGLSETTYPYYAKGLMQGLTSHKMSIFSPEMIDPDTMEIKPFGGDRVEDMRKEYGDEYPNFEEQGHKSYKTTQNPAIRKRNKDAFVIDRKIDKTGKSGKTGGLVRYAIIDRNNLAGVSWDDEVLGQVREPTGIKEVKMPFRELVGELGSILNPKFKAKPPIPDLDIEAIAAEGYKRKIGSMPAAKAPRPSNANKIEQAPRVEEMPPTPVKQPKFSGDGKRKSNTTPKKAPNYADIDAPNTNNQTPRKRAVSSAKTPARPGTPTQPKTAPSSPNRQPPRTPTKKPQTPKKNTGGTRR